MLPKRNSRNDAHRCLGFDQPGEHLRGGDSWSLASIEPAPLTKAAHVLIARVRVAMTVAMLPDARAVVWRDGRPRVTPADGLIAAAFVIGAIATDLFNLTIHLIQPARPPLAVGQVVGGDHCRPDLQRRFIHAYVQLTPGPSLRVAMRAHVPLTFAEHLDTCGIDHRMQRLRFGAA
jgi:hypothetical protein